MVRLIGIVDQSHRNLLKYSRWSSLSEYLVNLIGMNDQLEWNIQQDLYQNGSFGKVYKLEDDCVTVMLDTNKTLVTFGYHEWAIENYVLSKKKDGDIEDHQLSKEKVGAFYQIPLKLAYAITMHKSQGQTYDQVNLIPYSFDNGQLYVALSRVKSIEGLCLINQLRQENLICSQEVKDFYHIGSSKNKDNLIYELGKKVLETYPKEIQDLIDEIHKIDRKG